MSGRQHSGRWVLPGADPGAPPGTGPDLGLSACCGRAAPDAALVFEAPNPTSLLMLASDRTQVARVLDVTPKAIRAWECESCPIEEKQTRCEGRRREALLASDHLDARDVEKPKRREPAKTFTAGKLEVAPATDEVVAAEPVLGALTGTLTASRFRLPEIPPAVAPKAGLAAYPAVRRGAYGYATFTASDEISGSTSLGVK